MKKKLIDAFEWLVVGLLCSWVVALGILVLGLIWKGALSVWGTIL